MSERSEGKIALEEHFYLPSFETFGADGSALDGAGKAQNYLPDFFASVHKRLGDDKLRLEEMDRCGIELMILSLTQPGIQGIADHTIAVETAKKMNDDLAQIVAANPKRYAGFAAVALQDVRAAGDELERAVKQLGFKGALINGYTNIGDANTAQYLDEQPVWDFWARVEALGVPVYLHPRSPLPNQAAGVRGLFCPGGLTVGVWRGNGPAYASSDLERAVRPLSRLEDHSRPPWRGAPLPFAACRISASSYEPTSAGKAAKAGDVLSSRELLSDHRRQFSDPGVHRYASRGRAGSAPVFSRLSL